MEDVIKAGRIAGIGFYEILDYTWGEVQEYVDVVAERQRLADIRSARLLFTTTSALSKMFSSSNGQIEFMQEYDWLFTEEEHKQAKINKLYNMLEGA